jgi:ketosteroid isomerase-like protein
VSQQNVAIVRKGIDAWNRHNAEEWLSYAAPEITWEPAGPAAVEQTVYRGHEEVASGFESVWETWEEFQFEEGEVRDLGESVLWLGHVKLKGSASHLQLEQEFAVLSELSDGSVTSVRAFLGWPEALAAAGLGE